MKGFLEVFFGPQAFEGYPDIEPLGVSIYLN
jgi:hypothetical protein